MTTVGMGNTGGQRGGSSTHQIDPLCVLEYLGSSRRVVSNAIARHSVRDSSVSHLKQTQHIWVLDSAKAVHLGKVGALLRSRWSRASVQSKVH